jgi:hypothetical protein
MLGRPRKFSHDFILLRIGYLPLRSCILIEFETGVSPAPVIYVPVTLLANSGSASVRVGF